MILINPMPMLATLVKPTFTAMAFEPVEYMDVNERKYTGRIIPIKQDFWLDDDIDAGIELMMTKQVRKWDAIFPYGGAGQNKARVGPNDISYIKTRF